MRGRYKRRGFHQSGYKQNRNIPSEDLCPHCYSFGCDPTAMSPAFRKKIDERLRKGLCPCCGKPKNHCKCKSSLKVAPGVHTIRTHNNKKMRQEIARIKTGETALKAWEASEDQRLKFMDTDQDYDIWYSLYNHKMPVASWEDILAIAKKANLGQDFLNAMYPIWH